MSSHENTIKWLARGYLVMCALFVFFSLFSLSFLIFGILFLTTDILVEAGNPEHAPYVFGTLNIGVSVLFISVGIVMATLTFRTGRKLRNLENYRFCIGVSIVLLLFQPLGTILGAFSLFVLLKDSVKKEFDSRLP